LANAAHDDDRLGHPVDSLGQLVGDAGAVRDAFEQMPVVMVALAGPDHRIVAANAAYRSFTGRSGVIGVPCREAFPEVIGQQLYELFDRVYATGKPETGTEWRTQFDLGPAGIREVYADFTVTPQRSADQAINGLLMVATNVTDRVAQRQAEQRQAAEQRMTDGGPGAQASSGVGAAGRVYGVNGVSGVSGVSGVVGMVAELQEALLPTALPVLPQLRIAARYLVAGHEQSAGGDWFDAVPLAGGGVALVVGDVVGHGVAASAAMGQLRAVLGELLVAEPDLGRVLARADAFAARTPALQAATLTLAVFDQAADELRYATCGHPPPLVVGADGTTRFLAGTGTGPLGTGSAPVLARATLAPGELLLLYSDGLIERPNKSIEEGLAELAKVAADAAANRTLSVAAPTAAERVCELTVELLTRTGYADDVTTLAAERLAEPVPALELELPSERASLTVARGAFSDWLIRVGATAEDAEALHLAMVEVVTNAIEHAYPPGEPGIVELTAALRDDGTVECRIVDHGTWRPPDSGDADRGHGLMVAGHVVDSMVVSHPAPPGARSPGVRGTVVVLRLRLRRPAVLASGHHSARAAARTDEPPFTVAASIEASGAARALVAGPVDIVTADQLSRRLLSVSRGGTVPLTADLTAVTQLASAGVRALYLVRKQLMAHQQALTLITAPGSSTHAVLDLVRLAHVGG
jgi:serine phosphatase RsbU (regulator of sigma subunit)/anti-sigma regulatory factor (Ser/Thr protein kinase)/anti-anti-sigma regulatory factor